MTPRSQSTDSQLATEGGQRAPSLERPALLAGPSGRWLLKLFPTAGEATLTWDRRAAERQPDGLGELVDGDPRDREAEYGRRAAGRVRRWLRRNGCAYMWTFTFRAPVFDYVLVSQAVARFYRRVREHDWRGMTRNASQPPFLLVPEPHPGGHGWHLHGATDRYLKHALVAKLWGEGFVFVTRGPTNRRGWAPRTLSRYLAKYIGKGLDGEELHGCAPRPCGGHRYWVTEGRDPEVLRSRHDSLESAVAYLHETYGHQDVAVEFGGGDSAMAPGIWFEFPDRCIARWVERVQAESRAQRGQP